MKTAKMPWEPYFTSKPDVSEWTAEMWAECLDRARDDMMTMENCDPSDIAHVMTCAAQKLRDGAGKEET
jgi:hypothetical protein